MCDNQVKDEHFHIKANCLDMPKLPEKNETVSTKKFYQCVNVPKRYESPSKYLQYLFKCKKNTFDYKSYQISSRSSIKVLLQQTVKICYDFYQS